MPKSKVRKKTEPTVRTSTLAPGGHAVRPSPRWYPIVMAAILLIGLAWIVVYYLAGSSVPGSCRISARGTLPSVSA